MGKPDAPEDAGPKTNGTADQRALAAMAIAAHRAREGIVPGPPPTPPSRQVSGPDGAPSAPTEVLEGLLRSVPTQSERETGRPELRPQTTVGSLSPTPRAQSERRLMVALFATAALVAAVAISLVVVEATRHQPSSNAPPATPARSTTHHPRPGTGKVSTTLPTPTPGAAPVISSLSPSSGAAGQVITILGANFMSPSGHIGAHVGSHLANIACPAQSTCTVTVPPADPGAPSSVSVTVTTDSGTSNAANFTYR
jgi:hypothetical protein